MTPDPVFMRIERDPLGEHAVPADAYYGIQTVRAVENFPISGLRAPAELVTATVLVKKAATQANIALARLDRRVGEAIVQAADEILSGALADQFIVDVYQAGAGTSHNMNVNEVLANRASEILGGAKGEYRLVHPNDHVNMGQSTNDVFPTATRLALLLTHGGLVEAARALAASLGRKADAFTSVIKVGRTHLQDAVPITLGQEFGGYAACIERAADDVVRASEGLKELNLGATAVGTGLNAGDDYTTRAVANIGTLVWHRRHPSSQSLPRDAEHGRRACLLGNAAASGHGAVENRERPAPAQLGTTRGVERDHAAGGAAGLVDHARQGQPVGPRDGESGVLSGVRLRRDDLRRRGGWPTRVERDDAGDRLERATLLDHPAKRDEYAADPHG